MVYWEASGVTRRVPSVRFDLLSPGLLLLHRLEGVTGTEQR